MVKPLNDKAAENSKRYLLTKLSDQHADLNIYIRDYLSSKSSKQLTVEVITQAEKREIRKKL